MRCSWATSVDEIRDVEGEWEALRQEDGGSIYTSPRLDLLWYRCYPGPRPRVLVMRDGRDLVGIVPMALSVTRSHILRIKDLYFAGGRVGKLRFNHMSALLRSGRRDVAERAAHEILRADWNLLRMHFMPPGPQVGELTSLLRSAGSFEAASPVSTVTVPLPPTGDVMAGWGERTRRNTKYKLRRLERERQVSLRSVTPERARRAVDVHVQQHVERWRAKGGSVFSDPENAAFLSRLVEESLSQGFGFMYELVVDGQVAAQDFGLFDGDMARMYRGGICEAFAEHSPGMLLACFELEELRGRGVRAINMGRGSEDYKLRMGGELGTLMGLEGHRGLPRLVTRLRTMSK